MGKHVFSVFSFRMIFVGAYLLHIFKCLYMWGVGYEFTVTYLLLTTFVFTLQYKEKMSKYKGF